MLSFLTVSATFFRLLPQQQMIAIDLFCIWWLLFNPSIIKADEVGSGYDAPTSTHFESTLTQNKMGAGLKLLWSKSATTTSDYGNQTSLATLSSIKADEERPNGTLDKV